MNTWRVLSRRVILKAIAEGEALGLGDEEMKRHISKAYPFGERAMWPYKVWLAEVRRQMELRRLGRREWKFGESKRPDDLPGQGLLFGG